MPSYAQYYNGQSGQSGGFGGQQYGGGTGQAWAERPQPGGWTHSNQPSGTASYSPYGYGRSNQNRPPMPTGRARYQQPVSYQQPGGMMARPHHPGRGWPDHRWLNGSGDAPPVPRGWPTRPMQPPQQYYAPGRRLYGGSGGTAAERRAILEAKPPSGGPKRTLGPESFGEWFGGPISRPAYNSRG